ncbi:hypothetical protein [Streptomyces sp. NPDC057580]|uniref:hypothetical protein n=1 Tax=Streptomyces sp. NPDC057580 TaxID=3346173 RepID=UPI00368EC85F
MDYAEHDPARDARHRTSLRRRLTRVRPVRGQSSVGVRTGARVWEADHVVNCAGPDAGGIAALADVSLPLARIPGLVGESTPVPEARLGAILATPGVDLRPASGARVCSIS